MITDPSLPMLILLLMFGSIVAILDAATGVCLLCIQSLTFVLVASRKTLKTAFVAFKTRYRKISLKIKNLRHGVI
jgi:hypothetical protein